MKKIFIFATLFALSMNVANAQNGTCGDALTWTLSGSGNDKTLIISGTGTMNDWTPGSYGYSSQVPWWPYYGQIKSITVEDGVTTIGNCAFGMLYNVTSVTIPNSVTSIGSNAFHTCYGLPSLTIPSTVTTIGASAFARCSALSSADIPNGIAAILNNTFQDCTALNSVSIPNTVTSIGESAFRGCTGLASLYIPSSVTSIGAYALSGCGLISIDIPNSVTSFSGYSILAGNTAMVSVTLPNSLPLIPISTFQNCSGLASINIPNSVKSINGGAFLGCQGLTSVTIPESVTTIDMQAFQGCTGLRKLTLGKGVALIRDKAFGQSPLDTLISLAVIPPTLETANVFHYTQNGTDYGTASDIPVYIPCGALTAYNNAANWRYFEDIRENCETNINSVSINLPVKLYPNPVHDKLFIQSEQPIEKVEILDASGRVVVSENATVLHVSQLQKGVYFVKIFVGNNTITKKIIKE